MPKHLFTIPNGTVLPDPANLPEGYPFRLEPDNVFYALVDGVFVPLTHTVGPATPIYGSSRGGSATVAGSLTSSAPPFSDTFVRSDRTLNGDNGWINSTGLGMGFGGLPVNPYSIVSNKVQSNSNNDSDPILHVRNDSTPGVADVSVIHAPVSGSNQRMFLFICSDLANTNSVYFDFSGLATLHKVRRHVGADALATSSSSNATVTTDFNGGWAAWSSPATMTVRCVYTESTKLLEMYQNGVKKMSCDMSASNFANSASGELPLLSTMPYCGFTMESAARVTSIVCA